MTYVIFFSFDAEVLYQEAEAETNGHNFADNIFKCIFLYENI